MLTSRLRGGGVVGWRSVAEAELAGSLGEPVQGGSTLHPGALPEVDEVLEGTRRCRLGFSKEMAPSSRSLTKVGRLTPRKSAASWVVRSSPWGATRVAMPCRIPSTTWRRTRYTLDGEGDLFAIGAEEEARLGVTLDEAGQVEELVEILGEGIRRLGRGYARRCRLAFRWRLRWSGSCP